MKTLLITLAGALAIGAALPANAGPDWQLIEQARKAKLAKLQQKAAQPKQDAAQSQAMQNAATPASTVYPLDHGPRAQVTPWENRQRKLRDEQEARAKANAEINGTSAQEVHDDRRKAVQDPNSGR